MRRPALHALARPESAPAASAPAASAPATSGNPRRRRSGALPFLLTLLATTPPPPPAAAQQEQILPETIVTGSARIPAETTRIPAAVTVVTRQEIEERGYRSLAEALSAVPGLHLVQAGGIGQQASAFLRGTAGRHVRVLLDGVPIEDPSDPNGAFNFGNELLGDIERIEVVRGPASALYGSGAIGGVVNLVTRRAAPGRAFAPFGELAGGTQRTLRGTLGAAGDTGSFDWMLAGQALTTQGFNATAPRFFSNLSERDGLHASAFTARLGATPVAGTRIEALLRWRENVFGLDDVPRDDPNYSGSDRRWFGLLRGETRLFDGRWTTGLRLAATQDRRRYENLPDAGNPSTTYDLYRGERMTLDWANTLRLDPVGPVHPASIDLRRADPRPVRARRAGPRLRGGRRRLPLGADRRPVFPGRAGAPRRRPRRLRAAGAAQGLHGASLAGVREPGDGRGLRPAHPGRAVRRAGDRDRGRGALARHGGAGRGARRARAGARAGAGDAADRHQQPRPAHADHRHRRHRAPRPAGPGRPHPDRRERHPHPRRRAPHGRGRRARLIPAGNWRCAAARCCAPRPRG